MRFIFNFALHAQEDSAVLAEHYIADRQSRTKYQLPAAGRDRQVQSSLLLLHAGGGTELAFTERVDELRGNAVDLQLARQDGH